MAHLHMLYPRSMHCNVAGMCAIVQLSLDCLKHHLPAITVKSTSHTHLALVTFYLLIILLLMLYAVVINFALDLHSQHQLRLDLVFLIDLNCRSCQA